MTGEKTGMDTTQDQVALQPTRCLKHLLYQIGLDFECLDLIIKYVRSYLSLGTSIQFFSTISSE